MNTRETLKINNDSHLEIGGCDALQLAATFGTPLYVFDEAHFVRLSSLFSDTLINAYGTGEIAYASKAFACKAVYAILKKLGLSLDVVSGGELYAAIQAGFAADKIYFHGNSKTIAEIEMAVGANCGTIVVESIDEVSAISDAAAALDKVQGVMIRLNPVVEAHTHSFVQTANKDSKFGIEMGSAELDELLERINIDKHLSFEGLHVHIGSQIFEVEPYKVAVEKLCEYIKKLSDKGFKVKKLNLGGGFGITYTDADPQFKDADYVRFISEISIKLLDCVAKYGIDKPTLIFEPGRSLVGEAGITLYTVCAIKDIPDVRKYVSIDGGMFDNPRYALYGSQYEAIAAGRAADAKTEVVTLAGKCCESGDLITKDVSLQKVYIGDIVAVLSTGAYNYSMASNYNSNPIPPVVAVYNGKAEYFVKPQSYEDLFRNNVIPDRLK